ncbi:MAG: NAD-dependent epimerase/dehydratase family protein [Opitutales bacterium]
MKQRILVTGGGGFLGRSLVRKLLVRGDEVHILGRSPQPDLDRKGVRVISCDLADSERVVEACRGMDTVFHVAARAGVWGSWRSYYEPNVQGTLAVIEGCRKAAVPRLVHTSTPSVVFNGEPLRNADERMPYGKDWLCHYAHTKALAEREVLAANEPGKLSTVALRPHLIWGVGDTHLIPRVVERARQGKLRIVGAGENLVDIVHVENASEAHLLAEAALDEPGRADGKAYFITQGEPVVLWTWINDLLRRLGAPPVEKRISLRAAYAAGATLEGVYRLLGRKEEPPMTRFVAVELAKDHYFDLSAARRDLAYEPRVSTEAGLEELVRHWEFA